MSSPGLGVVCFGCGPTHMDASGVGSRSRSRSHFFFFLSCSCWRSNRCRLPMNSCVGPGVSRLCRASRHSVYCSSQGTTLVTPDPASFLLCYGQGWCRMHRDMLVHNETNAYLHVSKTWEKVLEVSCVLRGCAFIHVWFLEGKSDLERKICDNLLFRLFS